MYRTMSTDYAPTRIEGHVVRQSDKVCFNPVAGLAQTAFFYAIEIPCNRQEIERMDNYDPPKTKSKGHHR